MNKIKNYYIRELLKNEKNVENYLIDLKHAEIKATKENLFNYLYHRQEEIRDVVNDIVICILRDLEYVDEGAYERGVFERLFFKYFSDKYLDLESIIFDYSKKVYYKSLLNYII